jgi:hypothetical protein
MNIEKILCPKVGKLIKTKDSVNALILDADLDTVELSFDYTQSVTINTDGLKYICLTYENLYDMIELLEKSEKHFKKKFKN